MAVPPECGCRDAASAKAELRREPDMKPPDCHPAEGPVVEPPAAALRIPFVEFVALTALLMALTALSIDIMLPALPDIGRALGVTSENDRQLVVIVYMAGFATGQLFHGALSDHFGRRPVLLAGLAIFIAGTLAALLAQSFTALLAARLVQGVGAAAPRVIALAVVRDLYSGRRMARVMSFAMMVFIIIPVLAPTIGQALIHVGDWRWTFHGLLVAGLVAMLWSGLRLPETSGAALGRERAMTVAQGLAAAVLDRQTIGYGAASGFMFGCLLAYVASSQQVFVELYDLGALFPVAFGAIASLLAVSSFTNGRIVGRLGMRFVSHSALAGFVAVSLALALAATLGLARLPVFVVLVAAAFYLFGLIAPNFNALAMEPQGQNAGMASSIVGSLSTAIGAVVGGVIGHSFDGTALPLALGFAASSIVSAVIVLAVEGRSGLLGRNREVTH